MLDLDFQTKDGPSLPFRLVDTAGLRRRKRVSHSIEYFSTVRTRHAIDSSDIVFLVIDAEEGSLVSRVIRVYEFESWGDAALRLEIGRELWRRVIEILRERQSGWEFDEDPPDRGQR